MSKQTDCGICCEKYNLSTRKDVKCEYTDCEFSSCKTCVRTYVLGTTSDPHCMNCKKPWAEKFLVENLNRAFCEKEYKAHRKNLLVEREISKLPETMNAAEKQKKIEKEQEKYTAILDKIKEINKELKTLKLEQYLCTRRIGLIKRGEDGTDTERRKFIMACPNNDCRGYLSTQYKCDLCELFTCSHCIEIIGYNKTDEHTCNPDNVASAELIKKDTKPCPQCGVRIHKISGCFAPDTPILLWDGDIKLAKNITVNDTLIGDDGEKRNILELTNGRDQMYLIKQNNTDNYIVNSKHILTLKFTGDGTISYIKSINKYVLKWFDNSEYKVKNKHFNDERTANEYKNSLNICLIDIPLLKYLELPKSTKTCLKGIKSNGINWDEQYCNIDPYILGSWLGDGYSNGKEFASNDTEIIEYWIDWAKKNDAEVVKTTNPYRYYVKKSSTNTQRLNPLKKLLSKYNLINNKHIPKEFLINSRENRLKLLAGIIDTGGCVSNNGRRIVIIQVNFKLTNNIKFLAKSLGFSVNITIRKCLQIKCPNTEPKDYNHQYCINISGYNLHEIPTILPRKQCNQQNGGVNLLCTNIIVIPFNEDNYYGWRLDKNNRFLLGDFTIAHNCSQMWCTECNIAFDYNTLKIDTGAVHNPHYYQHLAQQNNGQAPRNPQDILCGGLCGVPQLQRVIFAKLTRHIPDDANKLLMLQNLLGDMHRTISHITYYELPSTRTRVRTLLDTEELRVNYILGKRDNKSFNKNDFATLIYKKDIQRKKYNELLHLYELLSVVGIENFNLFKTTISPDYVTIVNAKILEFDNLRIYCNKEFGKISVAYNHKTTYINHLWQIETKKYKLT
jgi:hypothetical protein